MRIHSVVDVITNSSSEIYTWPHGNAIQGAKDLIAAIMAATNTPGTPDDYFDFSLEIDEIWADDVRERCRCWSDLTEEDKERIERYISEGGIGETAIHDLSGYGPGGMNLVVTPKRSKENLNFLRLFKGIFTSQECDI